MRILTILLSLVLSNVAPVLAQTSPASAARAWHLSRQAPILDEFRELLAIPNVAANLNDMRRNAEFLRAMFAKRGIVLHTLDHPGAPAALFGEIRTPGARRTLMLYVHYDGQPVDPLQWTITKPFEPVIRDDHIWARSASDDKAPFITITAALDALKHASIGLGSNIKFFFDGEEEAGSPHIGPIIEKHKDLLGSDIWIFCDGPVHQNRMQQIVFGARGSTGLQITVYGPRRELHSGHYGNWATNPVVMLAHLLASMKDDETGRVLVKDFYKDVVPLSEAETSALSRAPRFDEELKRELGLARVEGDGRRLDELINQPALNFQGIASAGVGPQTRNVIPAAGTAALGIRLVKGTDWRRMQDLVIAHIRSRGYHIVESDPDLETRLKYPRICKVARERGYNAVRAPMDLPIARQIVAAVESARGKVIQLPTLGGSLPIAPISETLNAPVILLPIANHDNNQHGHNENLRLRNLWDGIETMAAVLAARLD